MFSHTAITSPLTVGPYACVLLMLMHILVSATLLRNCNTFEIFNPSEVKGIMKIYFWTVIEEKNVKLA